MTGSQPESINQEVSRRLEALERQVAELAEHVNKLAHRMASLDKLSNQVGDLRREVEDFQQY